MIAVIFEVWPKDAGKETYLKIASELKPMLENRDGFISIERFESLVEEGKLLSLSFWQDEAAIARWRNEIEHRQAQKAGKEQLFERYRIRVASVVRDYSNTERAQVPEDSSVALG